MDSVYVKDKDGYVYKKQDLEVLSYETVITEKEYLKKSGLATYKKKFTHGGARQNAGRKQKYNTPLKFQIRVTQEEKDFISYARKYHINYSNLIKESH